MDVRSGQQRSDRAALDGIHDQQGRQAQYRNQEQQADPASPPRATSAGLVTVDVPHHDQRRRATERITGSETDFLRSHSLTCPDYNFIVYRILDNL